MLCSLQVSASKLVSFLNHHRERDRAVIIMISETIFLQIAKVRFAKESVRIAADEMKVCSETYNAPSKLRRRLEV